jgi:hypothetical protein
MNYLQLVADLSHQKGTMSAIRSPGCRYSAGVVSWRFWQKAGKYEGETHVS